MIGMLDDMPRAFRMGGHRRVGVLRLQLQKLGLGKRLMHDARTRPQQHVAPRDAVQIGPQMPVGAEDDLLVAGKLTNDLFRSEEHTSELQSLMRNSYAVFCLK